MQLGADTVVYFRVAIAVQVHADGDIESSFRVWDPASRGSLDCGCGGQAPGVHADLRPPSVRRRSLGCWV